MSLSAWTKVTALTLHGLLAADIIVGMDKVDSSDTARLVGC